METYAYLLFQIKEGTGIEQQIEQEIIELKEKMKKYLFGVLFYRIPVKSKLFLEAKQYYMNYSQHITFDCSLYGEYEEADFEKAVAYVPEFKRICVDYEESKDVFTCGCEECCTLDQIEDLEIKPQGMIKKYKNTYATFVNEMYGSSIISVPLYEYLIETGIECKYFRPVYTKKDKTEPIAYQLYSEFILPEQVVDNPSYEKKRCNACGRVESEYSKPEEFYPMTISKEGLEVLQPVSMTAEYLIHYKTMIISKEMYKLIKEKDKKAKFTPVFLRDQNI